MELQLSLFAQIEQLEQPTPELPVLHNYSYTEEIGVGSVKEKVKRNLEAIRLLQLLEETGRHPNDEQKAVLAQYMGFGLAPELFMETPPASWQELACLLKELVSTEQWYQLRSNVTNAYYTSPDVIREVHQGLMYLGFTGGKILEPGLGSGLWIGLVPETIQHRCKWTGVEIDPISGKIAQLLYPEAEIHIRGFQEATLPYNFFDLTCGNVPFGTSAPTDPTMPRIASTLHDYFFVKAMHLARPGGLIAMLTSVVHYLQSIASWSVDVSVDVATSQNNTKVYGTSRIAAHRLIEMALNLRVPIVKDKISDEEYVVNKEETRKARTSQENLKDKFKRWLWSDLERADRLTKLYNEKYVRFVG